MGKRRLRDSPGGVRLLQRPVLEAAAEPVDGRPSAGPVERSTFVSVMSDIGDPGFSTDGNTRPVASFTASCERLNRKPKSERAVATWLGNHYAKRHTRAGSFYAVCPKA